MDAIVAPAVLILGIFCFRVIARFEKRMLTRNTSRTAGSMDGNHADPSHQQRGVPDNTAARGGIA